MSDSTFNADLDALVRGEGMASSDDLTRFVADIYGEEHQVTMPHALKIRIANDLGIAAGDPGAIHPPVSRRTVRAMTSRTRSSRPWAIALTIAATMLLALTGILRWGLPTSQDSDNNRFLGISPAIPTVEATPAAESEWLQTYTDADCPEDELIDRGEWFEVQTERSAANTASVPRVDNPYGTPDMADAEAAATRQRQAMACVNKNREVNSDALPVESSRRAWENSAEASADQQGIGRDRLERSKALSAYVQNDLGITASDLVHVTDSEQGLIWDPAHAVQMADGRIALLPGWAAISGPPDTGFDGFAPVWIEEDGEWRLDEELFFCIGDCDEYWQRLEGTFAPDSTPVASPIASPAEETFNWNSPITPEECMVVDSAELADVDPDQVEGLPAREYNVIGPANPADAEAATRSVRQYMACDNPKVLLSDRYASETMLAGEGFSPFQVVMLERQWKDGISLSAQLQDHGITLAAPLAQATADSSGFLAPHPESAFALEDGRVLVTTVALSSTADGTQRSIGTTLILVHEDGEWKIDDVVPVCFGACDDIFSEYESLWTNTLWLLPIVPEECETNTYLPASITADEIARIRSRQYRACELSGDAQSLQGPEFQVTAGNESTPRSDEISTKYLQNGRTPGALQRTIDSASMSEIELPGESWTAFQPGSVVSLDDGRIAVIESTVEPTEYSRSSGRTSPVITQALIWNVEGDTWLLDEEVTVCLGSCEAFWSNGGTVNHATPVAMVIPETCQVGQDFRPDLTSDNRIAVSLRPGPGMRSGTTVATVAACSDLMFLCESAETENPSGDRMDEGQVWMKVRTEDGTEGWIREIDVRPID